MPLHNWSVILFIWLSSPAHFCGNCLGFPCVFFYRGACVLTPVYLYFLDSRQKQRAGSNPATSHHSSFLGVCVCVRRRAHRLSQIEGSPHDAGPPHFLVSAELSLRNTTQSASPRTLVWILVDQSARWCDMAR